MPDSSLVVSEIFGPTVQGEGPELGRRCGFVRLGRCNLACDWCDTPYTWDWSRFDASVELTNHSIDSIVARLATMAIDTVVLTGGEPLLQQRRLVPLIEEFRRLRWRTHVETSGTLAWQAEAKLIDRWVVSPKLANSGLTPRRRLRFDTLRGFVDLAAVFKFVAVEPGDLDEIAHIAIKADIPATSIWVMAEGTSAKIVATRTAALADEVVARGWNLTTRLHVLAWGNKRGR